MKTACFAMKVADPQQSKKPAFKWACLSRHLQIADRCRTRHKSAEPNLALPGDILYRYLLTTKVQNTEDLLELKIHYTFKLQKT